MAKELTPYQSTGRVSYRHDWLPSFLLFGLVLVSTNPPLEGTGLWGRPTPAAQIRRVQTVQGALSVRSRWVSSDLSPESRFHPFGFYGGLRAKALIPPWGDHPHPSVLGTDFSGFRLYEAIPLTGNRSEVYVKGYST